MCGNNYLFLVIFEKEEANSLDNTLNEGFIIRLPE